MSTMNILAKLSYLNIFRKCFVFYKYLSDNISNGEFRLMMIGLKYIFTKKTNTSDLIVKTNNGLFLIRKNTIDFKLANSAYEISVFKHFNKLLPEHDLFIDIGANIGTYSIVAAKTGLNTLAFEPVKANFESLVKNISLNNLKDLITPYLIGLSDKSGTFKFNYYPLKPGASSIHPLKNKGEQIDVKIEVFDQLNLDQMNTADNILIKIDVEGMEMDVLKGMANFLESDKKISLIIETKHSGEKEIKNLLNKYAPFRFEKIDIFNMLAKKI